MSEPTSSSLLEPPTIELEPGSVFAGKYRVERMLGQGGAGTVFAALHLGTGRRVAVKILHGDLAHIPEASGRLLREAQLTGLIRHPNIVDIYDVGMEQGTVYLVMEYLRGQPLSTFLGNGPMQIGAVIHSVIQAMHGIAAAHAAGIVHRDLKPDNIFICCGEPNDRSRFKVLDFGVSKLARQEPGSTDVGLTVTGAMVGTPYYMAPEQIRDSRTVDHRADIYALGVVLFEALSGRRPFSSETLGTLLLEIMQEGLPSLATLRHDIPDELVQAVDKAVARAADDRFQTVEEMVEAVEPFAEGPGLIGWDAYTSLPPSPVSLRVQTRLQVRQPFDSSASLPDAAFSVPLWKRSEFGTALAVSALVGGALLWWGLSHWNGSAQPGVEPALSKPATLAGSDGKFSLHEDARPATMVKPARTSLDDREDAEATQPVPTSNSNKATRRKRATPRVRAPQPPASAEQPAPAATAPRQPVGRSGVDVSLDEF